MRNGFGTESFRNFNYALEVEGVVRAGFSEVALDTSPRPHELLRDESVDVANRLALSRGFSFSRYFYEWRRLVVEEGMEGAKRSVVVTMFDELCDVISRSEYDGAWPSDYKYSFDVSVGVEVIELLELTFDDMRHTSSKVYSVRG